jgi:hypothetical protein
MGKAVLGGRSSTHKLGDAELCSSVWLLRHTLNPDNPAYFYSAGGASVIGSSIHWHDFSLLHPPCRRVPQ